MNKNYTEENSDLKVSNIELQYLKKLFESKGHTPNKTSDNKNSNSQYIMTYIDNNRTVNSALLDTAKKLKEKSIDLQTLNTIQFIHIFSIKGYSSHQYAKNNLNLLEHNPVGVWGIEFCYENNCKAYSPIESVYANKKHDLLFEDYIKKTKYNRNYIKFRYIYGNEYYYNLNNNKLTEIYRGNKHVAMSEVNKSSISNSLKKIAQWYKINIDANGHLAYSYKPSLNKIDNSHNETIRLNATSYVLNKIATHFKDDEFHKLALSNLRHNLDNYYKESQGKGIITYNNECNLGALAFVNLGILTSKQKTDFKEISQRIDITINSLHKKNGHFESYLYPKELNDRKDGSQDFFPGETLYYWATKYETNPSTKLLSKIMQSFYYYRQWHLDESIHRRRHPAFIPWQTQAFYKIWKITKNKELKDFIFKMNDWLLPVQQWDSSSFIDIQGRFYDEKRQFGIPHASATAVYIEGLIDAYQLAYEVKDKKRMKSYKLAISRGLRSLLQLQYNSNIDYHYIKNSSLVEGAFRTSVFDNSLRIDIQQHIAFAFIKVLNSKFFD